MIDRLVRYLHEGGVGFRLNSYPSPEPQPAVAVPQPPHGVRVDTWVLIAGETPVIACGPAGSRLNYERVMAELHVPVLDGSVADLPAPWKQAGLPLPPFGGLYGVPLFVDESLAAAAILCIEAFTNYDILDVAYEDFERLERPRIMPLAIRGEIPDKIEDAEAAPPP